LKGDYDDVGDGCCGLSQPMREHGEVPVNA